MRPVINLNLDDLLPFTKTQPLRNDPTQLTDATIMRQVQAGQTALFAELTRRYQPALVRVARSRLRRADWAEDVVQETFLAAFKSRHTFRSEFSFRTWLWTILLNQCRALWHRQARAPEARWDAKVDFADARAIEARVQCTLPLPLADLMERERGALLETVLDQLSDVQADALRLRFYGGLKFQEIADTMDCSLGTAKNRVQAGLLRMSDLLRSESCYHSLSPDWLASAD